MQEVIPWYPSSVDSLNWFWLLVVVVAVLMLLLLLLLGIVTFFYAYRLKDFSLPLLSVVFSYIVLCLSRQLEQECIFVKGPRGAKWRQTPTGDICLGYTAELIAITWNECTVYAL